MGSTFISGDHTTRVRWFLVFWLFILSAVSYLDRVNIATGESTLLQQNDGFAWLFTDPQFRVRYGIRYRSGRNFIGWILAGVPENKFSRPDQVLAWLPLVRVARI